MNPSLAAKWASRMLPRDALVSSHNSRLRLALCKATGAVNAGLARWSVSCPRVAELYARALISAVLLSSHLEGEERAVLNFAATGARDLPGATCAGAIQKLYAEAMAVGEVRASVVVAGAPPASASDAAGSRLSPSPTGAGGDGGGKGFCIACAASASASPLLPSEAARRLLPAQSLLSVRRIRYNERQPHESVVQCRVGDVVSDLSHYFETSEQIPTVLYCETHPLPAARGGGAAPVQFAFAGGAIAQRLAIAGGRPGGGSGGAAAESTWEEVRGRIEAWQQLSAAAASSGAEGKEPSRLPPLAAAAAAGRLLEDTIKDGLLPEWGLRSPSGGGEGAFRRVPLDFHCRCSRDTVAAALGGLSDADFGAQADAGAAAGAAAAPETATCQFCNTHYQFVRERSVEDESKYVVRVVADNKHAAAHTSIER